MRSNRRTKLCFAVLGLFTCACGIAHAQREAISQPSSASLATTTFCSTSLDYVHNFSRAVRNIASSYPPIQTRSFQENILMNIQVNTMEEADMRTLLSLADSAPKASQQLDRLAIANVISQLETANVGLRKQPSSASSAKIAPMTANFVAETAFLKLLQSIKGQCV